MNSLRFYDLYILKNMPLLFHEKKLPKQSRKSPYQLDLEGKISLNHDGEFVGKNADFPAHSALVSEAMITVY